MKRQVVSLMKKWWLTALILVLALSLTSCSRSYPTGNGNFGFTTCTGTIGDFDVYTIANYNNGSIRIIIVPYTLDAEGDIATVAIGAASGAYRVLIDQIALMRNAEITADISEADYNSFPYLAITTYVPGEYGAGNPAKEARCEVPQVPYL